MGNFQICLDATAPLLLYLAAGYLARRLKQIDSQDVSRFNSVVFNFFLTVNQFKSIYFSDLSTAVRPGLILFSALGVLTSCGIGLALSSKLLPREQRGVMTQGIFRSNLVLIGIYIAETLVPDGSVGSVAVLGAIVIPLFNVLAVVVLSLYGGGRVSFRSIFIKVLKNPLILSTAAGLLCLWLRVPLPLEKIAGHEIKSEDIAAAIKVYNKSRAARREFVKLASDHCDVIDPIMRSAVLKAAWFMDKAEYTEKLNALNAELKALPAAKWNGVKVVTSGIICDNPTLLKIFKDNNVAIAADDVAHESRAFRTDASEEGDPMMALVDQFTNIDYDVLLYDPQSNQNRRGEFVAKLVKDSGAQGLVLFMQQFCDPEEMEYPYLKKALDAAGVPHIKLGVDQQMRDFGQASTAIQAFADVL